MRDGSSFGWFTIDLEYFVHPGTGESASPETMNEKLEHFLLYELSDDWAPIAVFDGMTARITPEEYSREHVLAVIRELADHRYIRFGAFPGGGRSWEPWTVSVTEALDRIAHGYNDVPGYLAITDSEIDSHEVFRADLLENGEERLAQRGDPYEKYGDPWAGSPRRVHC